MVKIADQVNSFDAVYLRSLRPLHPARTGWLLRPAGALPPGVRIKVGDEPANLRPHSQRRMHRFFNSGVSDIFPAEQPLSATCDAVVDVVKAKHR